MAPSQHAQSSLSSAQHDAADVKINQSVFAVALILGVLVVLSAISYLCYYAVCRWRKVTPVEVDEKQPPRPLVLPAKVEEAAKAPKRLILSPLYTLPLLDLEDLRKDALAVDDGQSWRASLHAMGNRSSVDLGRFKLDFEQEDEIKQEDVPASLVPEHPPPPAHRHSYRLSLNLSQDIPPIAPAPERPALSSSADTPSPELPTPPLPCTVVEVIHSYGSSPNIVVEDFAPPASDSSSSIYSTSSAESDSTFDGSWARTARPQRDFLKVPPMSWTAPRDPTPPPPPPTQQSPKAQKAQKVQKAKGQAAPERNQLQKKGSMTRLVAALGEITNVARLRPKLPLEDAAKASPTKGGRGWSPKKKAAGLARKEN